jgi:hypothetical protein
MFRILRAVHLSVPQARNFSTGFSVLGSKTGASSVLQLSKTFGEENIHIVTDTQDVFDENNSRNIHFLCTVQTAAAKAALFDCRFLDDGLLIEQVFTVDNKALVPQGEELDVQVLEKLTTAPHYSPDVDSLEEDAQDALYNFLHDRSVDDNLCAELEHHIATHEDDSFSAWKQDIETLVGPL